MRVESRLVAACPIFVIAQSEHAFAAALSCGRERQGRSGGAASSIEATSPAPNNREKLSSSHPRYLPGDDIARL